MGCNEVTGKAEPGLRGPVAAGGGGDGKEGGGKRGRRGKRWILCMYWIPMDR